MGFIDLTGMKFKRLLAIKRCDKNSSKHATWVCKCDCGNETIVDGSKLRNGHTKSCGCLAKETMKTMNIKHSMSNTRPYNIWRAMRDRCNLLNNKNYKNYGSRGITYDKKWETFEGFWEDMKEGYQEKLTIDRINPNGNYEKLNCRWTTQKIQQNNRRNNHIIEARGEKHTISEWSSITGISQYKIKDRINLGWDNEKILIK